MSYYFLPFIIVNYHANLYIFIVLRFLVCLLFFKNKLATVSYDYYSVFNDNKEHDL